mmetsp:Transcript_5211/g.9924  ORF Transcript_5211/g.9924 Transcript_5211/m.9924 type:complete len:287 (+) Transcript_5211:165-1025(+)
MQRLRYELGIISKNPRSRVDIMKYSRGSAIATSTSSLLFFLGSLLQRTPTSMGFAPHISSTTNQQNIRSFTSFDVDKIIEKEITKLNLSKATGNRRGNNENDRPRNTDDTIQPLTFRKGNPIQVEVTRFGPLGASVEVIARSHQEEDVIAPGEAPLGYGLILQKEISYFRAGRGGLDVVLGEILPAYVDWVRDDGKIDVSLRKPGGKGKAEDLSKVILDRIREAPNEEIEVGDKSSPDDVSKVFPGASKAQFKRAVAALYKRGLVEPGAYTTRLMQLDDSITKNRL